MKFKTLCIIFFITCTVNAQLTNSYKRIKDATLSNDEIKDVIDVQFKSLKSSKKVTTKTKKTIFDLSEKAQDELIVAYSKFEKTSKKFRTNLVEPLEKSKTKPQTKIDKSLFTISRTFELFINDTWSKVNPANRIASIKISMTLNSNDMVKFSKFNGYQTKHEYFDIGTIEGTKTRNFSLEAGVGASTSNSNNSFDAAGNQVKGVALGFTPSVTGSFGTSNSFKENIVLRRRYIAQSGSLSNDNISIYMEGAPLKNLNGPLKVEFDFEAVGGSKIPTEIISFRLNEKKELKLRTQFLMIPKIDKTVTVNLRVEWLYRKVVRKGNTSYEGDDIIQYYQYAKDFNNFPVFDANDLKNQLFTLRYKKKRVYIEKIGNSSIQNIVRFRTQEEAINFLDHILENKVNKVDNYMIKSKLDSKIIPVDLLKNISIESDFH